MKQIEEICTSLQIFLNMKIRKITNWALAPLFLLTLWSGIELHVTDYYLVYEEWHSWSVVHSIAGILMAAFIVMHFCQHWKWYSALSKPVKVRKARVRRCAVMTLTVLFAVVIVTGLWILIFVIGADSRIGHVHFWLGILALAFAIGHILKRRKQLFHK